MEINKTDAKIKNNNLSIYITELWPWANRPTLLPNGYEVPLWVIFVGGMEKDDIQGITSKIPNESEKQDFIATRTLAGEILTKHNVSTYFATQFLLDTGCKAYISGNREEWAVYANAKVSKKTFGCLKFIMIPIVILIFYFLFF